MFIMIDHLLAGWPPYMLHKHMFINIGHSPVGRELAPIHMLIGEGTDVWVHAVLHSQHHNRVGHTEFLVKPL